MLSICGSKKRKQINRVEAKGIYEELIISPEENWKLDKELLSNDTGEEWEFAE